MNAADVTGAAIAKRLASCSKATRDCALRLLESWLPTSAVSDDELLKIWKGLFYCVWHADKTPVQVALVQRLASVLPSLPPPLASRYLAAFLSTIRREWSGIDHLRLDKFYILIRRMLHQCFAFLKKTAWDPAAVNTVIDVLSERTLLVADKYPAEGVNYHIAQVFLDEIMEFLPLGVDTLDSFLKPFFSILETSSNKTLVAKVRSSVFDRLLDSGHKFLADLNAGGDGDSEAEKLGKIALAFGFSKRFLNLASAITTVQSNRKIMFLLHERFSKLEKGGAGKSGLDVLLRVQNGDLGNVPSSSYSDHVLIQDADGPVPDDKNQSNIDVTANGSSNSERRSSKKRKTCKKGSRTDRKKKHSKQEYAGGSVAIASETEELQSVAGNGSLGNDESMADDTIEKGGSITFSEILMSNLQKQFEKVAAEDGMVTPVASTKIKKRKRVKSADGKASCSSKSLENLWKKSSRSPKSGEDGIATGKSTEKSVKRVRFSMKSNLVWKPHSPLPPQSLRLPPSATPRGSALKKGVPPGPVKETPPSTKKVKVKVKASSLKKARKITKSASPGAKRLKKLQSTI